MEVLDFSALTPDGDARCQWTKMNIPEDRLETTRQQREFTHLQGEHPDSEEGQKQVQRPKGLSGSLRIVPSTSIFFPGPEAS